MSTKVRKLKVLNRKQIKTPTAKRKRYCGVIKKDGTPCKAPPMANGRCRIHGGINKGPPKGSKNPTIHGLYSIGLHDYEKPIYEEIGLGTLDDELKMAKIRLRRAHKAQRMWEEQRGAVGIEVDKGEVGKKARKYLHVRSIEVTSGKYYTKDGEEREVSNKKVIRSKRDFSQEIVRLTKLVADLEIKRKELIGDAMNKDKVHELVLSFREFSDEAMATLPGGSN